ncbi:MAG: SGNH/GDSL hydrolase family protein [Bacteroidales bacterium]|nr:SGNH/GDSL hydrolase family protein [Bacteroidales bacterium]
MLFRVFCTAFLLSASLLLSAQESTPTRYVEASGLTLVGKLMETSNPYWRVDTARFKGFSTTESNQVRCGAGLAVAFRTDSPFINLRIQRRPSYLGISTTTIASAGFDLYIREGKHWIWAGDVAFKPGQESDPGTLVRDMDGSMRECLLYLPIHTELYSCELGVAAGSTLESLENPFRHSIVFSGSSFTHGSSTSRPGMSYPAQFERHTGLHVLPLGCGGNGRLQPHYADVFAAVEADAFVFDQFSNGSPESIRRNFFPFLEKVRAAHPGVPIIFQRTIRRENGNFDTVARERELEKKAVADSVMKIAMAQDPDVYYIQPCASDGSHEWTVDGTHPSDYGYYLWSRSIEKPIKRILRRYGIR